MKNGCGKRFWYQSMGLKEA